MSLWNSFLSNTVGLAYQVQGKVDPWNLQNIQEDAAAGIGKASGDSADPGVIAYRQQQAAAEVNKALTSINAHPEQVDPVGDVLNYFKKALPSLPDPATLKKGLYWAVGIAGGLGVLYFGFIYSRTLKGAFKRK
jgi:hypothetical protein